MSHNEPTLLQREVLKLHAQGKSPEQIAAQLEKDVSRATVYRWFRDLFPKYFPVLEGLRVGSTAYDQALTVAFQIYDKEQARLRAIESKLEAEELITRVVVGGEEYWKAASLVFGKMKPKLFTKYLHARLYALGLNYSAALSRLEDVERDFREQSVLRGIVLNDLSNSLHCVGRFDEANEWARASDELFDIVRMRGYERADTVLQGHVRAYGAMQDISAMAGNDDETVRLGNHMVSLVEAMNAKSPDNYGRSKARRGIGWSAFVRGFTTEDESLLRDIGLQNTLESLWWAYKISAPLDQPWWVFRDGPSQIGGVWRTLVSLATVVDLYIALDDLDSAHDQYAIVQKKVSTFLPKRQVSRLPPFVPIFAWKLRREDHDLEDEAEELDWQIMQARVRGNLLYVPLLCISRGDLERERKNGSRTVAKSFYEEAKRGPSNADQLFKHGIFAPLVKKRRDTML